MKDWKVGDFCNWSPEGYSHGTHGILAIHEGSAWLLSQEGDHDTADLCDLYPAHDIQVGAKEWRGPQDGLPPTGLEVEVCHQGRWITATTVGIFGDYRKCMVCAPNGGGFFGFYPDQIRPIRTPRDLFVEQAGDIIHKEYDNEPIQIAASIHEALANGTLAMPEVRSDDE